MSDSVILPSRGATAPLPALPQTTRRARRRQWRTTMLAYLYLLPALCSIVLWVYWPLLNTAILSFYQWNLLPTVPMTYVGWANFRQVITMPDMQQALRNTGIYILGLLLFSVLLPLTVAIVVANFQGKARTLYRALIFTPVLIAPVVVAVIWRWLLNPLQGLVTVLLDLWVGVAPLQWFNDRTFTIWVIVAITGWKLLGFSVLIFSAGIANINREYIDAADVDGASNWQRVRYITLPLLSPTIMFMILLTVLLSAQWTFPLINVLTQGGPLDTTTNVYYILWQFAFRSFNVGWSAAAAVLFFALFGVLALIFLWFTDRYSFYDS